MKIGGRKKRKNNYVAAKTRVVLLTGVNQMVSRVRGIECLVLELRVYFILGDKFRPEGNIDFSL